jgi:hypothetical protein
VRNGADDQPHSATWLELDETERIDTVMDYHRRAGVKLENLKLHAVTLGEPTPVPATLNRLVDEGACHSRPRSNPTPETARKRANGRA